MNVPDISWSSRLLILHHLVLGGFLAQRPLLPPHHRALVVLVHVLLFLLDDVVVVGYQCFAAILHHLLDVFQAATEVILKREKKFVNFLQFNFKYALLFC